MKKQDITNIFARTRRMLFQPEAEWQAVRQENIDGTELFRDYLVPLSAVASACTLLLQLRVTSPFYAVCIGLIVFISAVAGAYITYRVAREYLSNKVSEANRMALTLAVYSSAIFIPFHCLACGMSEGFISQLMAVFSLLCLRTLHVGLNQSTALDVQYRKSALVIIGLLVIVAPVIVQQLLMIVFRIPSIYA